MANKRDILALSDQFRFLSRPFWLYLVHFPPKQVSTIKFQISQPIVPRQVHCGHLWANLAECQKHTKSTVISTRGGSPLKPTPKVTTIVAHIVSQFQPCTPNISKVITKSVLGNSFQDNLILTLWPLRTSILVPPAAYVSYWGVGGAATHLSAITQSCLLCHVASRERCPTFIPFRHDTNKSCTGTALLHFRIKMRMIFEKITFQFISTYFKFVHSVWHQFISFKFIHIPTFVDT